MIVNDVVPSFDFPYIVQINYPITGLIQFYPARDKSDVDKLYIGKIVAIFKPKHQSSAKDPLS